MRRALVLTSEDARHPFRASLPAHVWTSRVEEGVPLGVPWRLRLGLNAEDVRGFVLAYSACFVAVSTFIA